MISQGKTTAALLALNAVLVHARTMAFEQRPYSTIAKVLDIAELLPLLLARDDDTTESFRLQLEGLAGIDEGFKSALRHFGE